MDSSLEPFVLIDLVYVFTYKMNAGLLCVVEEVGSENSCLSL